MNEQPVILFDGICNLCNRSVQFVIRHDPAKKFKFAALQSPTGMRLMDKYFPSDNFPDSFLLIENGKVFTRSTGALRVTRKLKGASRLLYGFIIVPPFIRDRVYDWISRNRFRWFGKRETCMIPSEALSERFLNS